MLSIDYKENHTLKTFKESEINTYCLFTAGGLRRQNAKFGCHIDATRMLDGAEFYISCNRPAFLGSFSALQVIQNSAPSTIV